MEEVQHLFRDLAEELVRDNLKRRPTSTRPFAGCLLRIGPLLVYVEPRSELRVDTLAKLLADAQKSRQEALELLEQVTAGFTPQDMSRERANEILHGCIEDYATIIKRLSGRHRG